MNTATTFPLVVEQRFNQYGKTGCALFLASPIIQAFGYASYLSEFIGHSDYYTPQPGGALFAMAVGGFLFLVAILLLLIGRDAVTVRVETQEHKSKEPQKAGGVDRAQQLAEQAEAKLAPYSQTLPALPRQRDNWENRMAKMEPLSALPTVDPAGEVGRW